MPVIVVGSTSYILPNYQSSHQTGFSAPREISNDIWAGVRRPFVVREATSVCLA